MPLATLNNTVKKLQAKLGGAPSTNQCPITVSYMEIDKDGLGRMGPNVIYDSTDSVTNSGTAVDVLAPAPQNKRRVVTGFSLYNADTAQVTATVQEYVDANTTRIIFTAQLQTLETLHYSDAQGWYAVDVNGNRKTNSPASSGAASTAQSIASAGSSVAASMASLNPATVSSLQSGASVLSFTSTTWSTVSSQASSIVTNNPATVSSLQSGASVQSFTSTTWSTVSSQASSIVTNNPATVSSLQSAASVQSFTSTSWSTVSSATSRVKSSFTW